MQNTIIKLHIDGTEVEIEKNEGKTILNLAQLCGIKIPTLCYHPILEPHGGCRLCMVEITKPSWNGWSKLVVSCAYPAEDRLIVKTNSEQVYEARKFVLELLLTRCPDSKRIQELADEYGIKESRFVSAEKHDSDIMKNCILCGLCVRVCRDLIGESILSFAYRGVTRKIMTPYGEPSELCLACGACAFVCPTGAIELNNVVPYRTVEPWHTKQEMKQCFSCGEYFIPVILADKLKRKIDVNFDMIELCSNCRRKKVVENIIP